MTKPCKRCGSTDRYKPTKKDSFGQCKCCRQVYCANHKNTISTRMETYRQTHKEEIASKRKAYNRAHKSELAAYGAAYWAEHKTESALRQKKRLTTDINFRLATRLRIRLYTATKRGQKSGSAICDLDCSVEELKNHLEKQFHINSENGRWMSWDNWTTDGWHIDHIVPLSKFDLTDREQFLKACHYTNLQPLWANSNWSKGNKLTC